MRQTAFSLRIIRLALTLAARAEVAKARKMALVFMMQDVCVYKKRVSELERVCVYDCQEMQ